VFDQYQNLSFGLLLSKDQSGFPVQPGQRCQHSSYFFTYLLGPDARRTVSKRLFDCNFCAHVVIVRSAYASVRV